MPENFPAAIFPITLLLNRLPVFKLALDSIPSLTYNQDLHFEKLLLYCTESYLAT